MKPCITCGIERERGSDPNRFDGLDPRCKVCINEVAKVSARAKRWTKLKAEVATWTDEKVMSELDWLGKKLDLVTAELRRRTRSKAG